jgi:SAM-dependent MidA family methyltransferase
VSEAAQIIARAIKKHGAISFQRFMQLALYCPVYGYYEKEEDTIGRRGDYYTSVSVGPLFGELLAFQFAGWLEEGRADKGGQSEARQILEAGAHNTQLARDILTWLRERRAELFQRLEYRIVEPSARRQEWQKRTLAEFGDKVRWVRTFSDLRTPPALRTRHPSHVTRHPARIDGIIFANELLDAMPVRRLGWDATRRVWFEWGVAMQQHRFVWTRLVDGPSGGSGHALSSALDPQLWALLPDGFSVEVCPAAAAWWRAAAGVLRQGKLLTIDYGRTAEEVPRPEAQEGTLRAYRCHRPSPDVLADPGEQDITAHVDFTAIQVAGEAAGLETEEFLTQAQFLTRVAARAWEDERSFGAWTPERTRQFQTLTHPEHLGRPFRVLVQRRPPPQVQGGGDCSS